MVRQTAARHRSGWLGVAAAIALLSITPAAACDPDPHDAEAEVRIIKQAYEKLSQDDHRKKALDQLMPRIDVSLAHLGPRGIRLHAELRQTALRVLVLERVPRWPIEKADALRRSSKSGAGLDAQQRIRDAETIWAQKRYDDAQRILDEAIQVLGAKVTHSRC